MTGSKETRQDHPCKENTTNYPKDAQTLTPMLIDGAKDDGAKDDIASKWKTQVSVLPSGLLPVMKIPKEVTFQQNEDFIDITGAPVTPTTLDDLDQKPVAKPKKTMLEAARDPYPTPHQSSSIRRMGGEPIWVILMTT